MKYAMIIAAGVSAVVAQNLPACGVSDTPFQVYSSFMGLYNTPIGLVFDWCRRLSRRGSCMSDGDAAIQ
jgi:hypothetical protein